MAYTMDYARDFTGGENSYASPDELAENQVLLLENADLLGAGGFRRRNGIEEYADLGLVKIDRLIEFEYLSGATKVLEKLALTNGNLKKVATGATLRAGCGAHLDYEVYKDKVYMLCNGAYIVYDGTTLADVTCAELDSNLLTIKKCLYIEQRGERLFACGNPDAPNALYFSEPGQPEYWKVDNEIQAITDDADKLTGLKEYHGALLAFKTRSVYAWFGYDPTTDVEFQRLSVHTGTRAYRTITNVGDYLMYLGEDGVYALQGTYKDVIVTSKLSKNITPRMQSIVRASYNSYDSACAVFLDGKYMLSVASTTEGVNDTVLVLYTDFLDKSETCWGAYTGWNISDFLKSLDGKLYSASSVSGVLHEHNSEYNDLGEAIVVNVKLRPLSQGVFIKNKKYRYGYAVLQQFSELNSHLTVSCQVDYKTVDTEMTPDEALIWDDTEESAWDISYWDFSDLVTRRFKIKEKGKRITLSVIDDTVDEPLVVYGFGIEYKIKKPDRR